MKKKITHERLLELLEYNPKSGIFRWKDSRNGRLDIGSIAGTTNRKGYRAICVDAVVYGAHRLAWFYTYKSWPNGQIDHINHDRADNRLGNLRDVSASENQKNQRNRPISKDNPSGVLGVYWRKGQNKWGARIKHLGREMHLGCFNSLEEATRVRKSAEVEFGFHENHGLN